MVLTPHLDDFEFMDTLQNYKNRVASGKNPRLVLELIEVRNLISKHHKLFDVNPDQDAKYGIQLLDTILYPLAKQWEEFPQEH